MMKDRAQKEALYRHFRARGWMAQLEVPITHSRGLEHKAANITDIDVLGIRGTPELTWEYIVGDCKTKRRESPVNRVLWARGLADAVKATTCYIVLKNEHITQDHRLFAIDVGAVLLAENEFQRYDTAIVGGIGSAKLGESASYLEEVRNLGARFVGLGDYATWLMSDAWANRDHVALMQELLKRSRNVSGEINPKHLSHMALVCETTAAFAIPFATFVGAIFSRGGEFTQTALESSLRAMVWGGRERYEHVRELKQGMLRASGVTNWASHEPEFPNWDAFLELMVAFLRAPRMAFAMPQFFRVYGSNIWKQNGLELSGTLVSANPKMLQLAKRMVRYVVGASLFPRDTYKALEAPILQRIAEKVADRGPARPLPSSKEDEQEQEPKQSNLSLAET